MPMFPDDKIGDIFRLSEYQKKALFKLGLQTVENILRHFPARYGDSADIRNIADLKKGDSAVIFGQVSGLKTSKAFRKKIPMAEAILEDPTGKIKIVWFHQPYLAKMLGEVTAVRAEGKVSERRGELYLSNPKTEKIESLPVGADNSLFGAGGGKNILYPVYPESRGVTSNWFYHATQKIFASGTLEKLTDSIPKTILDKYHLPCLKTALVWIHSPRNKNDAEAARKRFAFEEVFFIQLEKQKIRLENLHQKTFSVKKDPNGLKDFIERFPFKPTPAQTRAIEIITENLSKEAPMSRLLEGDVGSGKTAVAAAAAYSVVTSRPTGQDFGNLQVAYMAPTEILAKQHFESFIEYFTHLGINVGLITGSGCRKFPSKVDPHKSTDISRAQLLKWVANGEIPIIVGTHALIQKSVSFKHLAFVIIDEQHRFGTNQRAKLAKKDNRLPHLLSMTATPIPRTLALTIYGDLDLTLLDEMPAGRKPIITEIVFPTERDKTYEKIRQEIKAGRQAYVICPRIDEPDPTKELALLAKSVKEEAKRLKKEIFPEFEIDIMHSKLKESEKEKVMERFKNGQTNILVSTSVVEVGVNVTNATVILIEGADRFGLAQLHQLRGRVVRSNHQAYCYVFSDVKSGKSAERLRALKNARNGFELAELDLKIRGAGELYGMKQWGISDVGMEALRNLKMVEAARAEALAIVEKDPGFEKFPFIKSKLSDKKQIHFE